MHHVAIMNKSWKLIPKILSGEKSIESRWYRTRRTPWNKIASGDIIFFKNSGEPIIAKATVSEALQFELEDVRSILRVLEKYGKEICLVESNPETWGSIPRYCVLMRLKDAKEIKPFDIDKEGFGIGAAWLTMQNIAKIKK